MSDPARASAPQAPEPPWWGPNKPRRSRNPLSREAIVGAALAVLDRDGLDGLSMRKVAEELDSGAASLYWHVQNKDQLLDMVLDRVIGEIPLPEPDPERWREQLTMLAIEGRAAFRRYRDIARASMGRVPMGPHLLRVVEWQLTVLRGAGVPARAAAWFGDLLALYIAAHALEDAIASGDSDESDVAEQMGAYIGSLPPAAFPNLLATAPELAAGDADARFEFGLDLILRGLESLVEEHSQG